ncbi:BTAD domain-containing putative transcriptional regulator, partial [Streptomyces phaeochromogenes]|uniref:BTAD domain-containing putative transcriptional regulator n=1 Tax=Streptomyces phaeochromogenes TaxID=1923 RepID=UPI00340D4F3B
MPRPVSSAKGRVLLTALLLEPGRVVSVDVLKDALWGGTPPASAHASLQNHVTRLRRLLDDPDRLRSVPPGYQLRVSEGELDVRLFETRIGAARAAHARRDWERAVTEAVAALGLWRGTPLTGMPPGLGGLSLVQRLEEARLFALECRYEAELELGRGMSDGDVRLSGLAPELAALVAEFPLREAFHRQLMMVLYRTGRRAEALAVHRDLRRTLIHELGVEPGLTVREAHLEILRDEDSGTGAGSGTGTGVGAGTGAESGAGGGAESVSGAGSRSGPAAATRPGSGAGAEVSTGEGIGAVEAAASAGTAAPTEAEASVGRQSAGGDGVSAPLSAESASSRTDPRAADHPPSTEAAPVASSAPATPAAPGTPATPKAPALVPVPVPVPRPAQLPPAPLCFTGRAETIGSLRATLVSAGAEAGRPRVAVVSGMAGVGKSALGVQVAHGLRAEFPDGQLYVRLHGATPGVPPLTVGQALAALLRDLGVEPRGVPEHPDAASALLRSLLAPTRTLLVLDDAVNAAQVRPLLPAGPGCAVIVTSRSPLTALDGVTRFPLAPLSDEESAELLRAVSGRDGLDGTHPLVGLTGRLPLALRIVAARLAARQVLTPDALAGQLAASDGRLHHLEYDDLSVRRSLAVALDALRASDREADRDAALALRRIGALDLPTYGVPLLARLLGTGERRTEAALDRLVDVALLDETTYGRYAPHDLVRDFAREVAREAAEGEALGPTNPGLRDSGPTNSDPTDIALHWYIASARRCVPALIPSGVDRDNRLGAAASAASAAESERAGATGGAAKYASQMMGVWFLAVTAGDAT